MGVTLYCFIFGVVRPVLTFVFLMKYAVLKIIQHLIQQNCVKCVKWMLPLTLLSLSSVLLWMSVFWASIRRSRPNQWSFPRSEYFSWAWKTFPIRFDIDSIFVPLYSADISDDLKDLLFKMLDKNPETRITVPQIKVSMTLFLTNVSLRVHHRLNA